MAQESARHPVSLSNAVPYLMYFFISAPARDARLSFCRLRGMAAATTLTFITTRPDGIGRGSVAVSELQHVGKLALLLNWPSGARALNCGLPD